MKFAAWWYLAGVPSYRVLLVKAMLAGVGIWIFLNWLPLYFREAFGLTLGAAGFAGTFMLQISTVLFVIAGAVLVVAYRAWVARDIERARAEAARH